MKETFVTQTKLEIEVKQSETRREAIILAIGNDDFGRDIYALTRKDALELAQVLVKVAG